MSEAVSSAITKEATKGQDRNMSKEAQLRGTIRVLINRDQKKNQPILAAKRLAKHYQFLKDEVERQKERAFNYETGLARAERRVAQYKQDLYNLSRSMRGKGPNDESKPKEIQGSPFYLPSSIQQLVDALSSKNVALMRVLQKRAGGDMKVVELVQENHKHEELIKALRQELGLKSSLLEHYETLLSESKPKDDVDELAKGILEQRRECASLKAKLRSYESYVKHLRDKNTSLLETVMTDLDKVNRQPTESGEDEEMVAAASGSNQGIKSTTASQEASQSGSRRESLKDIDVQTDYELQSTGIQTDSGVSNSSSTRGSLDYSETDLVLDEQETLRKLLSEKESKEMALLKRVTEAEETCRIISLENQNVNATNERVKLELLNEKGKTKTLEEFKEESEAILQVMQERVEQVNQEHAEVGILKEKLREFEERESEVNLMQQTIKNYDEDIRSYMVERNQIVKENKEAKSRVEELEQQVKRLTSQNEQLQQSQREFENLRRALRQQHIKQQQQQQQQQQQRQRDQVKQEPWQSSPFKPDLRGQGVVADGAAQPRHQLESPSNFNAHQAQKERRLREQGYTENSRRMERPDVRSEQGPDDYQQYTEDGSVTCENCGDKYPIVLIEDHFRDCSRDPEKSV